MYYIYILQSERDNNFYTGYTSDLRKRINEHNGGNVISTKKRTPLKLVYFEGCLSQKDAIHREKYLKTSWGKRYIKNRIKNYLTGLAEASTKDISQAVKPKNFKKNKKVAHQGGNVAKVARKELEAKTGKNVVSPVNAKTILGESKKAKKINTKNKQ
ncbi:MAG: GIY-YIG nuclease family protein [Bacteroidetes bacterium]|nr:GIY-YIG nuclease family protein [Bacteroidota bacterium]